MLHITRERRELTRGTTDGDDALAPRPIRTFTSIRQRDIRDTLNGARDAIFIQSRRVMGEGDRGRGRTNKRVYDLPREKRERRT